MDNEFRSQIVQYYSQVLEYCHGLTYDDDQAQDLLHDTLEQALRSEHLYKEEGKMLGWLCTLAHNILCNQRKKEMRMIVEMNEEDIPAREDVPECKPLFKFNEKMLIGMSRKQREVFNLWRRGMTEQQIADKLGIPRGTVKSRMHGIRVFLRKKADNEPEK